MIEIPPEAMEYVRATPNGHHFTFDSSMIPDDDAVVIRVLQLYALLMAQFRGYPTFIREPLQIARGCLEFGTNSKYAKVYARWSVIDEKRLSHHPGCSNQNPLNPMGAFVGAEECGCWHD